MRTLGPQDYPPAPLPHRTSGERGTAPAAAKTKETLLQSAQPAYDPADRDAEPSAAPSGPIDRLLRQLRQHLADRTVARKARGEEWVRVPVTPDIEVHVRGNLAADQLRAFEQLADHMRHILLGDSDHD